MDFLTGLSNADWGKIAGSLGFAAILGGVSKAITDHWLGQIKDRTAHRRTRIAAWRQSIRDSDWGALSDSPEYAEMRQYVRPSVLAEIEHPRTVIFGGRGTDPRKHRLLDAIAHIEKAWRLI